MNLSDALFSLATPVLAGIYGIYWWEARRPSTAGTGERAAPEPGR